MSDIFERINAKLDQTLVDLDGMMAESKKLRQSTQTLALDVIIGALLLLILGVVLFLIRVYS